MPRFDLRAGAGGRGGAGLTVGPGIGADAPRGVARRRGSGRCGGRGGSRRRPAPPRGHRRPPPGVARRCLRTGPGRRAVWRGDRDRCGGAAVARSGPTGGRRGPGRSSLPSGACRHRRDADAVLGRRHRPPTRQPPRRRGGRGRVADGPGPDRRDDAAGPATAHPVVGRVERRDRRRGRRGPTTSSCAGCRRSASRASTRTAG